MIYPALLALSVPAAPVAQEPSTQRVEARVIATLDQVVHLDQGSDRGIEPGDRARGASASSGAFELLVRSVSRQSATCEIVSASGPIAEGSVVELTLPASRRAGAEHPPWTHPEEIWDSSVPLLAPARPTTPADRPRRLMGRMWSAGNWSFDHVDDEQRYGLLRAGADMTLENAFGAGDALRLDFEGTSRSGDDGNAFDAEDERLRVDRLSWRRSDDRLRSGRFEVGRFLHSEFAALGVIDGAEYVHRTSTGHRIGASVGWLPSWDDERSSGDDLAASVFGRVLAGANGEFSLGGALQKTWHRGEEDRDLVFTELSWRPNERWSLQGSAWVDMYGSDDAPKSSGLELTQAFANVNWRPSASWGAGLSASTLRWPHLLRHELPASAATTVEDESLERAGVHAWRELPARVRLSARADTYDSASGAGEGGEVRVSKRDLLLANTELSLALFTNQGPLWETTGARVLAHRWSPWGSWSLGYEWSEVALNANAADEDPALRQMLHAGLDLDLSEHWSLALRGETYFGDDEDAQALMFELSRRF